MLVGVLKECLIFLIVWSVIFTQIDCFQIFPGDSSHHVHVQSQEMETAEQFVKSL